MFSSQNGPKNSAWLKKLHIAYFKIKTNMDGNPGSLKALRTLGFIGINFKTLDKLCGVFLSRPSGYWKWTIFYVFSFGFNSLYIGWKNTTEDSLTKLEALWFQNCQKNLSLTLKNLRNGEFTFCAFYQEMWRKERVFVQIWLTWHKISFLWFFCKNNHFMP